MPMPTEMSSPSTTRAGYDAKASTGSLKDMFAIHRSGNSAVTVQAARNAATRSRRPGGVRTATVRPACARASSA